MVNVASYNVNCFVTIREMKKIPTAAKKLPYQLPTADRVCIII